MAKEKIRSEKVLVVDDQAQSYLKFSLDKLGFRHMIFVTTAQAAIRECESTRFDLILCNYNLSKGKDGFYLYEELNNRKLINMSTGFIFISSETDPELVHAVLELQPDDFLVKPFTLKSLNSRLNRVITHKQTLKGVYRFLEKGDYDEAMNLVATELSDPDKSKYFPLLLKVKGEILNLQKEFETAREFYKSILNVQSFTWAKLGLVQAHIGLQEFDEAEKLLVRLAFQPDTKVIALDLLGQVQFEKEQFQDALESVKIAASISPRNISRQKNVINLCRLSHDYEAQLKATQNIIKSAKHSIEEHPETFFSMARANIDYALIADDDAAPQLINDAAATISTLESHFPKAEFDKQLQVLNARLHYIKNERAKAIALIEEISGDSDASESLEDMLDKAKAFHELGFQDKAIRVIEEIEGRCDADSADAKVFLQYMKQEKQERESITASPKDLNNKAVSHYEKGELADAMEAFKNAYTLMPKNAGIALNLMQTIIIRTKEVGVTEEQVKLVSDCMHTIENGSLNEEQMDRYKKIKLHAPTKATAKQAS